MKKQSGFTLIELIIAVAIVGIMAAIAVPNFGGLMSNSRLKSTYNTFAGTLSTARAEAANRRTTITICASSNGTSCLTDTKPDWSAGYIAFADTDVDSVVDSTELVLKYETIPNGIVVSSASEGKPVNIAPKGRLRRQDTFVFCNGDDEKSAKALNLMVTGLGRLATDTDATADGIVNGIDDANVSCGS